MAPLSRVAVALAFLFTWCAAPQAHELCMQANAPAQRVAGTLTVGRGAFILRAVPPACMRGPEAGDDVSSSATVHLYGTSDPVQRQLRRLKGRLLEVVGTPFPAHTIHHHAPIVMEVTEIGRR